MGTSENHQKFQDRLATSNDAVWLVARWLWERGNIVEMRPQSVAPTHAEAGDHMDDGDLWFLNPKAPIKEKHLMEVKGLNKDFATATDWPFPYFLVCNKPSFDRKAPVKPSVYLHLNKSRTHAAKIDVGNTYPHWFEKAIKDPHYEGVTEVCYAVPIEHVKFIKL